MPDRKADCFPMRAGEIPWYEISDPVVLEKNPVVSVKMITYNHRPYVANAIEGVLRQQSSYPFELVIGEDCSTDGTRDIVLHYQKEYPTHVRVITSDSNVGMVRNGFRTEWACRGKYIAWCEGDDYWHHPLKLQKQVDYLESHPEVGLVHSGADTYYVTTKRRVRWTPGKIKNDPDQNIFLKILQSEYQIRTLTVVARRELLFNAIATNPEFFDETYLLGDHQRWLLLALVSKIAFIDESLATRNILPESRSHSKDITKVIALLESLYQLKMAFCRKFNCPAQVAEAIKQKHYETLLGAAFNAANRQAAFYIRDEMRKQGCHPNAKQCLLIAGASNRLINIALRCFMKARATLLRLVRTRYRFSVPSQQGARLNR